MPRFIHPNLHVILIHYPLALFTVGLLIELFSFLWRRSSFRMAGRWMILVGTLALLPAATSGIFALRDVAAHGADGNDLSWLETKQMADMTSADWQMARNHLLLNSIAAGIALFSVVTWMGCSDLWRRRMYAPVLLLLVIAFGLMTAGAWHGGEMVYRQQLGVKDREGILNASDKPVSQMDSRQKVEYFLSPMQLHVIMAGLVFAIAAAALGVTLRGAMHAPDLLVQRKSLDEAAGDLAASSTASGTDPVTVSIQPLLDQETAEVVSALPPRVPSSRFWVLSALLAILTIVGGFYVGDFFGHRGFFNVAKVNRALDDLRADPMKRRMGVHIIFGTSIVLLTLILAAIARWSPRNRMVLGLFSTLLVLVMAGQVWMGILLLYDTDHGMLTHFQTESEMTSTTQPSMPSMR